MLLDKILFSPWIASIFVRSVCVHLPAHIKGYMLDLVCRSGVTPFHFNAVEFPISDQSLPSVTIFCL